eukprot:8749423-Pyramimonas_sp.AAC.1
MKVPSCHLEKFFTTVMPTTMDRQSVAVVTANANPIAFGNTFPGLSTSPATDPTMSYLPRALELVKQESNDNATIDL